MYYYLGCDKGTITEDEYEKFPVPFEVVLNDQLLFTKDISFLYSYSPEIDNEISRTYSINYNNKPYNLMDRKDNRIPLILDCRIEKMLRVRNGFIYTFKIRDTRRAIVNERIKAAITKKVESDDIAIKKLFDKLEGRCWFYKDKEKERIAENEEFSYKLVLPEDCCEFLEENVLKNIYLNDDLTPYLRDNIFLKIVATRFLLDRKTFKNYNLTLLSDENYYDDTFYMEGYYVNDFYIEMDTSEIEQTKPLNTTEEKPIRKKNNVEEKEAKHGSDIEFF